MKSLAHIIICFLIINLVSSCGPSAKAKQQVKTLDSISGAINSALDVLNKTDTVSLNKILNVYQNYVQFINYRLNDTVTKSEAIELKNFFDCGANLILFVQNKLILQKKLKLQSSQISKLSQDVINQSINEPEINLFFQNELLEASNTIQTTFNLEKEYYSNLQKIEQSIKLIEAIIKSHNNNQLPTIINSNNQ